MFLIFFSQESYKSNLGKTSELLKQRLELLEERKELTKIPVATLTEATTRKVLVKNMLQVLLIDGDSEN